MGGRDETRVEPGDPLCFVVEQETAGLRADVALAQLCDTPRAQVRRWIEEGRVLVDSEPMTRPSRKLLLGDPIEIVPRAPRSPEVPAEAPGGKPEGSDSLRPRLLQQRPDTV